MIITVKISPFFKDLNKNYSLTYLLSYCIAYLFLIIDQLSNYGLTGNLQQNIAFANRPLSPNYIQLCEYKIKPIKKQESIYSIFLLLAVRALKIAGNGIGVQTVDLQNLANSEVCFYVALDKNAVINSGFYST